MAKEICISTTPHETRLAILEDDQLAEIYYERENEYTLAGSIYKGRVTRVLPGMQSSFVDVGLERDAFLYVTDFLEEQEDSEDYLSDGARREARPRSDMAEEGQSRAPGGERSGTDRPDRTPERNADRNPDRSNDRNQDRGGRRPVSASPSQPESTREPAAREGGRAGRERAREQAVAPLREAAPAAQDLEEKGDEESPEGTRRWRGRRGRRRGVRGGLAKAEPATLLSDSPQVIEEAGTAEETAAAPFAIAEHGAPGGIAALHASPGRDEEPSPHSEAGREPSRNREHSSSGRDRGQRRHREPYAQASTLDRPGQPGRDLEPSSRESGSEPAAPHPHGAPLDASTSIVLPGESLSKYGSAPPAAGTPSQALTATVPRAAGLRVNYVAPKPSTLVEVAGDWDGGAVLPGESLSRYREPAAASESAAASMAHSPMAGSPEAAQTFEAAPEPVEQAVPAVEAQPFSVSPHPVNTPHGEVPDRESAVWEVSDRQVPAWEVSDREEQHSEPAALTEQQAPARLADQPSLDAPQAGVEASAPLAEPEIMAAAVSPSAEAAPPHVAEPELVFAHKDIAADQDPDAPAAAEPAEYEPENASISYRVQATGSSELRLTLAALEEDGADAQSAAAHGHQATLDPAPEDASFPEALAEPAGPFEDADLALVPPFEPHSFSQESVPEFSGTLAAQAQAEPETPLPEHERASAGAQNPLQILHADGSIDLAEAELPAYEEPHHEEALYEEPHYEESVPPPLEMNGFDPGSRSAELPPVSAPSTDFSEMVDRLQGFAPGQGLLEEETMDEEEYDFEPIHAHGEDGDQEELEEETLDQQMEPAALSDAVRDSYLQQRVHQAPEAAAFVREEAAFGFEDVEEGDFEEGDEPEDAEEGEQGEEGEEGEEPVVSTHAGEPRRNGRPDDGRGRGRGRSSGRNGGRRNGVPGRGRSAQSQDLPIISELLKQGQEILVQIAKEPIAKKGARITSHIALPGRFLVFMPTVHHVGVSRKIASDEERQRLKRILISEKGETSGGFIVRTAAEGASEDDLRADLRFLISLWTEIKQRSDTAKAPALIYHDLNLIERILRDQVSSNFSTIWVDSEAEYERIIRFLSRFQPQLVRRVKLYTKDTPLFEHFGIQEEISKALKSKVWLKSGGSIVINQTEALVAIDINTGKYVGKTARLEDTIVKTNLDAIPEIVRQIRLRDLGGIIVIDFIDMDERKNRNRVLAALEEELKNDRAPSKVLQFNDFGLVAITRKRVKQSLERTLSVTCETCTGTGMVKSPITVCNEIYTEMRKMLKHLDGKDVMLRVHPEVVKQLKANNGKWINELEEMVTKTIIIKSDAALHPELFDIH